MSNKVVDWEDKDGRKYKVLLPANAPASHVGRGIRLGPPDLSSLGYPEQLAIRLHNELFARGLLTYKDVRANMQEVVSAVISTVKVDAQTICALYYKNEGGQ